MYKEDLYKNPIFYSLMFDSKITPVFSSYRMLINSIKMMNSYPNHTELNLKKHQKEQYDIFHKQSSGLYILHWFTSIYFDEESLTWNQVIEIRNDKQARNNIIRFRRWIISELIGKLKDEVEAILG